MSSVTLKNHKKQPPLNISTVKFGATIQNVLDNLNQYRGPSSQISKLYNPLGREIPANLWEKIQIKESIAFYVDQPQPQP